MRLTHTGTTVYVALSGGVDSSVAALLLKQQGYTVVGVFMKPWQTPGVVCQWQADRQDALRVAATLHIPLQTWDFSRAYYQKVTADLIRSYRAGRTPNPDVLCNQYIKFGLFYAKARARGADFIATGHYARIVRTKGTAYLTKAKDANKDQTYFLWSINSSCLGHTLFPVGNLTKPQVRALARAAGLITAEKKDSQGVCFVGALDMKAFLKRHIKSRKGRILHVDGRQLGWHDGAAYYTIGQRHGLDITDGKGPYYVLATDVRRNTVTVGDSQGLSRTTASLKMVHWFGKKPVGKVMVKVRYRTPAVPARLGRTNVLTFTRPARAIAAGQSAVLYQGQRLVGGGVLA